MYWKKAVYLDGYKTYIKNVFVLPFFSSDFYVNEQNCFVNVVEKI